MTDDVRAWTLLLDAFEADLDAGDGAALTPVDPPSGPPPAELVDRARAVLERHRAGVRGLDAARVGVARELAVIRRIPSAPSDTPVYLDVRG